MAELKRIVDEIAKRMEVLESVRDKFIKDSRDVLKIIREAMMCIHKRDLKRAEMLISDLTSRVRSLVDQVRQYPVVYYGGLIGNVMMEYAEVVILYNIVRFNRYVSPEDVGVEYAHYLLGLCDVVGELRRLVLDSLRLDEYEEAYRYFSHMENIYECLSTVIVSDALVPGFRHKVDVIRRVLEATREDLVISRLKRVREAETAES